MAQKPTLVLSGVATAPVTARRFVNYLDAPAAAGAKAKGVADYRADTGAQFAIVALGTADVEVGAAVGKGDDVKVDAQARAIPQGGAGVIVGKALTSATAAGHQIEILLTP